jgi:hypothetical protein
MVEVKSKTANKTDTYLERFTVDLRLQSADANEHTSAIFQAVYGQGLQKLGIWDVTLITLLEEIQVLL